MPQEFLERMKIILTPDDYEKLLLSYQKEPKKSIRIQLEKIDPKTWENIVPFSIQKIPILDGSYYVEEKLGNHPFHHAGLFYIQEPSAMLPPNLLSLPKNAKVLDLCASPGGKTLSLSNQVPEGFVLSNEINYSRAKKLLSNVERLGLKNVVVSSTNSNYLKKIYEGYFDVILIDAPCSGEGMFRKDDVARKDWSTEKIIKLSQIQKQLLEDSASMLKENGYLIYSTCTFSLEENEQQISNFLKHHDFHIVELPSKFDLISQKGIKIDQYSTDLSRRCYPFRYGEGQFMIVLQKNEQVKPNIIKNSLQELTKQEKTIVQEFLSANVNQNYTIKKYQSNIVILPSTIDIPKLPLLSCFVKMGDILSGRFIPHHQFIKAYGEHFKRTCDLKQNDPRVEQYLKGEEIRASVEDGYGVILIEGYPLGLYKAKNGILKNHYPKGLRK